MKSTNSQAKTKRAKNIIELPPPTFTVMKDLDGNEFRASLQQAATIELLIATKGGGIATVHGYKPTSNYVKGMYPTIDMQVLTRFSTENLYKRRMAALSEIRFSDIEKFVQDDIILRSLTKEKLLTLFNERLADEVKSMNKTIEGDRSDAHRQGHDRCYAKLARGIKINYVTEKVAGIMEPVLTDGLPTVGSVMIMCLEFSRVVRIPGEYRVVNSGAPVRMSNCIVKMLNSKSVGLKAISLKEGNFERFAIDKQIVTPEDVAHIASDILG